MKINVTVDLSEFYSEEDESSFNDQIKRDIAYQVKSLIWNNFKEEALTSFNNQVKRQIEIDKDLKIKETIADYFTNKKLKKPYSGTDLISLEEFIQEELSRNISPSSDFNSRVSETVRKQADAIGKELKDRYDLLFASQIVSNLNKNGMLKEDIAKILLKE